MRFSVLALAIALLPFAAVAQDTVTVSPASQMVKEDGTAQPGFTLARTGSIGDLPVFFTMSGSALMDSITRVAPPYLSYDYALSGLGTSTVLRVISVTSGGSGYTSAPTVTLGWAGNTATASALASINGGRVTSVTVTGPGAGYTSVPTVTFGWAGNTATAAATATITGQVSAISLVSNGSGYTVAPAVTIAAPTSGTTAVASVTSMGVMNITVGAAGTGYTAVPTVTIAGNAVASAQMGLQAISGGGGTLYTSTPTVTVSGGGGSGAVVRANVNFGTGAVTGYTILNPGTGYTALPTLTVSGGGGSGATASCDALKVVGVQVDSPGTGYVAAPVVTIAAPGVGVQATATVTSMSILGITVSNAGGGYLAPPQVTIAAPGSGTTAVAVASVPLYATIAAGNLNQTIDITPYQDGVVEGGEDIVLTLLPGQYAQVTGQDSSKVDVQDGDVQVTITPTIPVATEFYNAYDFTKPKEFLGRGEVQIGCTDNTLGRYFRIQIDGTATPGTDFDIVYKQAGQSRANGITTGAYLVGSTGITDAAVFNAGDAITFDGISGVYQVIDGNGTITPGLLGALPAGRAIRWIGYHAGITVAGTTFNLGLPPSTSYPIVVSVTTRDDTEVEGSETVDVKLLSSREFLIQGPTRGQVVIADDDAVISVAATANAGEPSTIGTFTISSNRPVPAGVSIPVTYQVINGTAPVATPDVDYTALNGSVTLTNGSTAVINVSPIADAIIEGNESVTINLLPSLNYILSGNTQATVNIADSVGVAQIAAITATAAESPTAPGTGKLRVSLVRNTTSAVAVSYDISGTATPGVHYVATGLTRSVTFPAVGSLPATSTADIDIPVLDDQVVNGNRTVRITLLPGAGYQVGTNDNATVTIADDEPVLSVAAGVQPSESGTIGSVVVSYSGVSLGRAVGFTYAVSGTAVQGTDYVALSGSATISATGTSVAVQVTAVDNLVVDPGKTIVLALTGGGTGTAYTVGTSSTASLTIVDNETPPVVVVPPSGVLESGTANGGGGGCGGGLAALVLLAPIALLPLRRRRR